MALEAEVTFQPEGKRARIKCSETILEAAKLIGADHSLALHVSSFVICNYFTI